MINRKIYIAPSILSADFAKLGEEIRACEVGGADMIHADVMDGHFVPNITIGPLVVRAIRPHTSLPISSHLMIENPDRYIDAFAEAGADYISIHAENNYHLHRNLTYIRSLGKKAGVVLNPVTPLEYAYEAAEYADFIMLMSVNPGFGGQAFINSFLRRCSELKEHLEQYGLSDVLIEVDGGVKIANAREIVEAGADILVCGSGLFDGDLKTNISELRKAVS